MPMTTPGKFDSNGAWDGFRGEIWQEEINVRDFIQIRSNMCREENPLAAVFHVIHDNLQKLTSHKRIKPTCRLVHDNKITRSKS